MTTIETFGARYKLTVSRDEHSSFIQAPNGFIHDVAATPGHLSAGIVFLSGWERMKKEFVLSYNHVPVKQNVTTKFNLNPDGHISVEFSPDDGRQARTVLKMLGLI